MKKILILTFILLAYYVSAQVNIFSNSIGIGAGTLTSIPLHINKTGEVVRLQGTSPYLAFYEGGNWNGYIQAQGTTFGIGTKNNFDLNFYTGDLVRISIDGSTGQTSFNQRINTGAGINNIGALRMAGNAGNLGEVLMSLGNGTPAWSSINQNPQIGFAAYLAANKTLNNFTEYVIDNFAEHFDNGNVFYPVTGEFIAPSAGLYHFFFNPLFNSGTAAINVPIIIRLRKNNSGLYQNNSLIGISDTYASSLNSNFIVNLVQGDVITFTVSQFSGTTQTLAGYNGNILFSGYKVY